MSNNSIPFICGSSFENGVHHIKLADYGIDLLFNGLEYLEKRSTLLVCFTAAVSNRDLKEAPFFSGLGISDELEIALCSIADPIVSESKLNLAWYAGSSIYKMLQKNISDVINNVCTSLNVENIILMGGSGGGFACLVQASLPKLVNCKVIVWNPQTSITQYKIEAVRRYVEYGFPNEYNNLNNLITEHALKNILEINDVIESVQVESINKSTEVIYLQNKTDDHVAQHLIPFIKGSGTSWKRRGQSSFILPDKNIGIYVGNWGEGHAVPPKSIISYAIKALFEDNPITDILQECEKGMLSVKDNPEYVDLDIDPSYWWVSCIRDGDKYKVKVQFRDEIRINCSYAYYLYCDGYIRERIGYGDKDSHTFNITPVNYKSIEVKAFLRMSNGCKLSKKITLI